MVQAWCKTVRAFHDGQSRSAALGGCRMNGARVIEDYGNPEERKCPNTSRPLLTARSSPQWQHARLALRTRASSTTRTGEVVPLRWFS